MKAEWRSASMECGGQCAMIALEVPKLCADSWDYLTQASYCGFRIIESSVYIASSMLCKVIFGTTSLFTQVLLPYPDVYFGNGCGPYLLDDVCCTGRESSLLSCNRGYSIVIHNYCEPGKAAGVKCGRCMMGEIAT